MTNHTVRFSSVLSSTLTLVVLAALGCDGASSPPISKTPVPPPGAPPIVLAPPPPPPAARSELPAPDAGAAGAAAPTLAILGVACKQDTECGSGHCSDGVCCDIACTGACTTCNLDGLAGVCSPVVDAPDLGTCNAPFVCGPDRRCGKAAHDTCTSDADCAKGPCRTYYLDEDGDGYGTAPLGRCDETADPPPGYSLTGGDCCDADARVFPGQASFFPKPSGCGTFDFDCNGTEEPETPGCSLQCGELCLAADPTGPLGIALSAKPCR